MLKQSACYRPSSTQSCQWSTTQLPALYPGNDGIPWQQNQTLESHAALHQCCVLGCGKSFTFATNARRHERLEHGYYRRGGRGRGSPGQTGAGHTQGDSAAMQGNMVDIGAGDSEHRTNTDNSADESLDMCSEGLTE